MLEPPLEDGVVHGTDGNSPSESTDYEGTERSTVECGVSGVPHSGQVIANNHKMSVLGHFDIRPRYLGERRPST
jgi:hypothetical protein